MLVSVDNPSTETTEADLRTAFEFFGKVQTTRIMRNRISGKSKGFGFVHMPAKAEAKEAIRVSNCTDLRGKALRIK